MNLSLLVALAALGHPSAAANRPRLVLVITVDQLRADYLDRWKAQLTGGFGVLVTEGAVFSNAFQDHAVTETAPGHASILSGRWPAHTGILRNDAGVSDSTAPLLETTGPGASPARFRGTEFFDWLKVADPRARALSVSRKDRAAILPIGRAKESVFWYANGLFTSSRYYADSLPAWVKRFNALGVPFKSVGTTWTLLLPDTAYKENDAEVYENGGKDYTFPHRLPPDSIRAAQAFTGVPLMDSLTLAFAVAGMDAMRLGKGDWTDVLSVSLSTTDAIGHAYGPDSREIHDQVLRLDRYLDWFLEQVFKRVGRDNVVIVLTADHGVTSYPEHSRLRGHPEATRVSLDTIVRAANTALGGRTGGTSGDWLLFDTGMLFVRNRGRLVAAHVNTDSVLADFVQRAKVVPGVGRVDRTVDLASADTVADPVARRWLHQVGGVQDVALVVTLQPWSVWGGSLIAMHGQPSDDDAHVPLIFWGKGFKRGAYVARAAAVDIAPTLAQLLGLSALSIVDGRVLSECLEPR
jgi:predicted AlkP superfamily pyrophosphatase or phosphodiesterase